MNSHAVRAVLFDLDGTLVDTAPDLIGTLQALRAARNLPGLEGDLLRPFATRGALGLLEAGFGPETGIEPASLREEFLAHYAANIWRESRAFVGIEPLLAALRERGLEMGVVTNKIEALARPVVQHAGWQSMFGCLVGGDSTSRSKPDPAPVLMACERLGVAPAETCFLGDDRRDVEAGRAAGTMTVVAAWGYLPVGEDIEAWGADRIIERPLDLLELFNHPT
jgi:N-acetyl-D-muramate 6-phosphate phosphatase